MTYFIKRIIPVLIVIFLLAAQNVQAVNTSISGSGSPQVQLPEIEESELPQEVTAKGRVISVIEKTKVPDPLSGKPVFSYKLKVKLTTSKFVGKNIIVMHSETDNPVFNIKVGPGDAVVLALVVKGEELQEAHIMDLLRENYLYLLVIIFVVLLLAIGKQKGAKALFALLLTLVLIWGLLLPGILKGYDPIILTVIISILATALTLVVVGGFTLKSLAAILGTLSGVLIAGGVALITGKAIRLTGFGTEEAAMLLYLPENLTVDVQGILFAGIIIGALGASMDVSMSIASAIEEVKRINPTLSPSSLIQSGMNVGRDIMGTMANTLILAYTGGSMQLILVFMAFKESFTKIINLDMVASEVVRALAGSIGMVTIIPLTAIIAGLLFGRQTKGKQSEQKQEKADFWQDWETGDSPRKD